MRLGLLIRGVCCALCAVAFTACAASAKATRIHCTTVLKPGKGLTRAIERAHPGATICLTRGTYSHVRLGSTRVDPKRFITIRSRSGRRATITGMSLARVHRLRFVSLRISQPVRFGGHDSYIDFNDDRMSTAVDLKLTRHDDPHGRAVRISITPVPPAPTPPAPTVVTPPVTPAPAPTPAPTPAVVATHDCFQSPGACGFPDPAFQNVGAQCSTLPVFNPAALPAGTYYNGSSLLEITKPDTTVANLDFPANMSIQFAPGSSGSTIQNICLLTDGGAVVGSTAIQVAPGVTGVTVENSTLGGANSTSEASDEAIDDDADNAGTTATDDYLYNCGECIHGAWTLTNSYVNVTAVIPNEHYEDWYFSDTTIDANHDVFFNPNPQTAEIFGDVNGGNGGPADNHVSVTDSLLGGGGFMFYLDSSSDSVGSSTMDISGNRFARCRTDVSNSPAGGVGCSINTRAPSDSIASAFYGIPDQFGYYANGGYFGIDSQTYCTGSGQTWSANVWDDSSAAVGCASSSHP